MTDNVLNMYVLILPNDTFTVLFEVFVSLKSLGIFVNVLRCTILTLLVFISFMRTCDFVGDMVLH